MACQAIRFQVFCRERDFLTESDYANAREQDEFDRLATHLAVVRADGTLLGTTRLVPHSALGFPLQRYCEAVIPPEIAATAVEVSRLAVPRAAFVESLESGSAARGLAREIALRLYHTVYRTAKEEGHTHLVAAMAPSLVRVLRSFDIPLFPIGPSMNYRGPLRPYVISIADFDRIETDVAEEFRRRAMRSVGPLFGLAVESSWNRFVSACS